MRTEYIKRPEPLKDGIKIIPERDMDIVNLGHIVLKADSDASEMKWDNGS